MYINIYLIYVCDNIYLIIYVYKYIFNNVCDNIYIYYLDSPRCDIIDIRYTAD